jgi:hypothetical protein
MALADLETESNLLSWPIERPETNVGLTKYAYSKRYGHYSLGHVNENASYKMTQFVLGTQSFATYDDSRDRFFDIERTEPRVSASRSQGRN